MTSTVFAPEFSLMDTIGALRGLTDVYARRYPQLQELDLRVEAPQKHWVVFEGSSHRAGFERPAEYGRLLDEVMGVAAAVR